jgi:hypothetical protein
MRRLVTVGVIGSGGFVAALTSGPHQWALELAVYLVFLCALVLLGLVVWTCSALPLAEQLFVHAGAPRPVEPSRLRQLAWMEQQLNGACDNAFELRTRFVPLVRQIASAILARRHGVVLEREPHRAAGLLGERLGGLLDADWEPAGGRFGRGLPIDELRRVIEELEAL